MVIATRLLTVVLFLSLCGCAVTGSREVFTLCKIADVVTTKQALSRGAVEANPLMKAIGFNGYVALSAVLIYLVWQYEKEIGPEALTVVNGITCGAAVHNSRIP